MPRPRKSKQTQIDVAIRWRTDKPVKNGMHYAQLRWRDPDPEAKTKRPQVTLGYVTSEQAEEERAALEAELRLGLVQQALPVAYSVADMLVDYLRSVEESPTGNSHADRVHNDCVSLGRHLGRFAADALTAEHARQYIAHRKREKVVRARRRKDETDDAWAVRQSDARNDPDGKPVSSQTVKNELATLRRAMKHANDCRRIDVPLIPLTHSKALPQDGRRPRRLREDEARALVQAARGLDTALSGLDSLIEVFAWSGRRPTAVYAVRVGHCARLVAPGLTREQRLMFWDRDKGGVNTGWGPLTEPAFQAILRRLEELGPDSGPDDLLWTTSTGTPWSSNKFPNIFKRIAKAASIADVRPYDLRKHACTQLYRALGDAHAAIHYSGHKTVEVFIRDYAYALPGAPESAAARIGWTPQPLTLVEGFGAQNGARND